MTGMPTDPDGLIKQAQQLIKLGKLSEARPMLASILKSNPKNAEAWYTASLLTGDKTQKISALKRALLIDPQHRAARKAFTELTQPEDKVANTKVANTTVQRQIAANDRNALNGINLALIGLLVGLVVVLILGILLLRTRGNTSLVAVPTAASIMTSSSTATSASTNTPASTRTPTDTPTITNTRTPTRTRTTTNTPTPTMVPATFAPRSTPEPITFTRIEGDAAAELYSAPGDWIGDGRGNFTFKGLALLTYSDNLITLRISLENNLDDSWHFEFYSPNLMAGQLVKGATRYLPDPSRPGKPEMSVSSPGAGCNMLRGEFNLEQQTPNVVISFSQVCDGRGLLRGKVSITPHLKFTPTPGVPPGQLLTFHTTTGKYHADLYTSPGFSMGGIKGHYTFEGKGKLDFLNEVLSFTLMQDDGSWWTFEYYAPSYQVGKAYENATRLGLITRHALGIDINSPGSGCGETLGEFKIESYSPNIVISFMLECDALPERVLSGTLTFTPDS